MNTKLNHAIRLVFEQTRTVHNVPVFAVGTWNGREFTEEDLDAMVQSFEDLDLAGHAPVKIGHDAPDTDEAKGWITELERRGDILFATLEQVPESLVQAVKDGKLRHVSIELLNDVQENDGEEYKYVVDGLAVLGAARPAVKVLPGLHELFMRKVPGLKFRERLAFEYRPARSGGESDELRRLREENKRLTRALVRQEFESQVRTGRIQPKEMNLFFKKVGENATLEEAQAWIAESPRPDTSMSRPQGRVVDTKHQAETEAGETPDVTLSKRIQEMLEKREEKTGRKATFADYQECTRIVMKKDPALAKAYIDMPRNEWGGR